MREIKYRGLSKNGWEYGLPYFAHGTGEWKIARSNGWQPSYSNPDEGESTEWINVDANTIGQFTGLKDKNGNEIYEGDIVEYIRSYSFMDGHDGEPIDTDRTTTIRGKIVFYPSTGFIINGFSESTNDIDGGILYPRRKWKGNPSSFDVFATVLGNIHETPELINQPLP